MYNISKCVRDSRSSKRIIRKQKLLEGLMNKDNHGKTILWIDNIILFCLSVLIFVLPIAHTASIRAFCIIFAIIMWIGKMVIEKRLLYERTPLDIPNLAFLLLALISSLTAIDPKYSLSEVKGEVGTCFLTSFLY